MAATICGLERVEGFSGIFWGSVRMSGVLYVYMTRGQNAECDMQNCGKCERVAALSEYLPMATESGAVDDAG